MALWRRKQYMVQRGMQLRFVRFVMIYMFICCLATAAIVFYSTFAVLSEKLAGIYPQHRLPEIFGRAYVAFFISLAASIPLLFYGALVFSHRIAGPLPKIYNALDAIGEGRFEGRLSLRKDDELKELVDHINQMAEKLKQRNSIQ